MTPLRVLIVGNLFPPVVYGGYEILCAQVVDALRRRGHEVRVLTSGFRAEEADPDPRIRRTLRLTTDFPRPGEPTRDTDFSLRRMHAVARDNQAATAEVLRSWRPDVVFGWCLNRLSLGPLFAARAAGVPVVLSINDEHPRQFRFQSASPAPRALSRLITQRLLWPRATYATLRPLPRMTVISQALKRRLLAQGAPVDQAEVILQGIDLGALPCAPTPRAPRLRAMYAGQLSAAKGVHTLIEAMGHVHGWDLDIYGDGVAEYESHLRTRVRELGLERNVVFHGRLPHARLCEAYRTHHALVFSSEWEEPFGLTHLEAMASGCAVVSTTTGGSAELVRDGHNALAFTAGDVMSLAARLSRLAADEPLRLGLIERARKWVETHHDFERYVDRLEGMLQAQAR